MDRPTQAILYRRVSTKEQGQKRNGLEAQRNALLAFCEREGLQVIADLEEVASAWLELPGRPVLGEAVDLARRTRAIILTHKLDRMSRKVEFVGWMLNKGPLWRTEEDGLDCEPMTMYMRAVFAENERLKISQRTTSGLSVVKARGTVLGITAHKKDPETSIPRARALAAQARRAQADAFASKVRPTIALLQRAGLSLAETATELNRMGTPTAKGGLWHASTVCNVLKRAPL